MSVLAGCTGGTQLEAMRHQQALATASRADYERLYERRERAAAEVGLVRRERVALSVDADSFIKSLRRTAAVAERVAEKVHREHNLRGATWEPHDWSEWS